MDSISTPSPAAFIYPAFLKKGIYQNLFTTLRYDKETAAYFGKAPSHPSWGRLYGAVLVTQALAAALLSTQRPDEYYCHQLQSVFLRGGNEKLELEYKVTDLKVTPNFINKKIEVYQNNQLCYIALISLVSVNESPNPSHSFPLVVSGTNPIDFLTLPDPNNIPLISEDYYKSSISPNIFNEADKQQLRTSIVTMPCLAKMIDRGKWSDPLRWTGKNQPIPPRTTFYVRLPQSAYDTFNISPQFEQNYNLMITQRKSYEIEMKKMKKLRQMEQQQQQQKQHQQLAKDQQPQNGNKPIHSSKTIIQTTPSQQPQQPQNYILASPLSPLLEPSQQKPLAKLQPNHLTLQQQLSMLALSYASDYMLIPMSLVPHNFDIFPNNIQFSSLNHNITFFTPHFDFFNDWLVFDVSAPFLNNSRTQLVGTFFKRDGTPVAMVTQECIFRVFDEDVLSKFPNPMNASGPTREAIEQIIGNDTNISPPLSAKL